MAALVNESLRGMDFQQRTQSRKNLIKKLFPTRKESGIFHKLPLDHLELDGSITLRFLNE